jgi:DNA-binding transcriptional LysR family regulator
MRSSLALLVKVNGRTPKLMRFCQWIRAKVLAMATLRPNTIRDQTLIVRKLRRADRTIVGDASQARVQHPDELNDRKAVELVIFMTRQMPVETSDGRAATLRLKSVFITGNTCSAYAAIKKGVGYGILPYWLINEDLKAGALIELCPDWRPPAITVYIAYPQARFRPARVKLFIEYLWAESSVPPLSAKVSPASTSGATRVSNRALSR